MKYALGTFKNDYDGMPLAGDRGIILDCNIRKFFLIKSNNPYSEYSKESSYIYYILDDEGMLLHFFEKSDMNDNLIIKWSNQ